MERKYLTEALFRDVVASFEWPQEYTVEEDLPDGMMLRFPQCTLYFYEGYEGDVELRFLPEDTGVDLRLELFHALMVLAPPPERDGQPIVEGLYRDVSLQGSEAKVRHNVYDLCLIALTYLKPVMLGDFSWVAKYRAMTGR